MACSAASEECLLTLHHWWLHESCPQLCLKLFLCIWHYIFHVPFCGGDLHFVMLSINCHAPLHLPVNKHKTCCPARHVCCKDNLSLLLQVLNFDSLSASHLYMCLNNYSSCYRHYCSHHHCPVELNECQCHHISRATTGGHHSLCRYAIHTCSILGALHCAQSTHAGIVTARASHMRTPSMLCWLMPNIIALTTLLLDGVLPSFQ